jgi:type IV pilus assembly protein PilM
MITSRVAVLDCGAGRTTLAIFAPRRDGRLVLERWSSEVLALEGGTDLDWVSATGAAAAALGARVDYRGAVALVWPGHLVLTKSIRTPRVDAAKREKVIQFEAAQNIPYTLAEVVWGHTVAGETETECEVLLGAAKIDVVESLCAAIERVGLRPGSVQPAPLALLAAYRRADPAGAPATLLLEVDARTCNLLSVGGRVVQLRSLALGQPAILRTSATRAGDLAEHAGETRSGEGAAAGAESAVDESAARLALEITRTILFFQRRAGAAAPARVVLTSGAVREDRLAAALAAQLNLPVVPFDALRGVRVSAAGAVPQSAVLAGSIGAAALLMESNGMSIDLLTPARRGQVRAERQRPWLIAAAVLTMFSLLPPAWHLRRSEAELGRQIAAIEGEVAPLRAREARNRENVAHLDALRREVGALQSIHDRRASWPALFADLQERLNRVEDVWLDQLEVLPAGSSEAVEPAGVGWGAVPSADALAQPLRLALAGRMLDRTNPTSHVSDDANRRVVALLAGLGESPFVSGVERERYDASQPGVLRFEFVLVGQPARPL